MQGRANILVDEFPACFHSESYGSAKEERRTKSKVHEKLKHSVKIYFDPGSKDSKGAVVKCTLKRRAASEMRCNKYVLPIGCPLLVMEIPEVILGLMLCFLTVSLLGADRAS